MSNPNSPASGQSPTGQPETGQPETGQPPAPKRGRGRAPWYLGGGVVLLAAIGVTLWLTVFAGGSSAGSPTDAAKKFAQAEQNQDVNAVKAVLCKDDLAALNKDPSHLLVNPNTKITSYAVTGQQVVNGITLVATRVDLKVNGKPTSTTLQIPVVQEDGSYRVCASKQIAAGTNGVGSP